MRRFLLYASFFFFGDAAISSGKAGRGRYVIMGVVRDEVAINRPRASPRLRRFGMGLEMTIDFHAATVDAPSSRPSLLKFECIILWRGIPIQTAYRWLSPTARYIYRDANDNDRPRDIEVCLDLAGNRQGS